MSREVDYAIDYWSIGVITYFLALNELPFSDMNEILEIEEIIENIKSGYF